MKKLPKICIPIKEKVVAKLIQRAKKIQKKADMLEIWLPNSSFNCAELHKHVKKPILLTIKEKAQHGYVNMKPEDILTLCEEAQKAKIQYVDIDFSRENLVKKIKKLCKKLRIVISWHDENGSVESKKLIELYKKMHQSGADIVKIIPTAKNSNDIEEWIKFTQWYSLQKKQKPLITFQMGEKGKVTRWMSTVSEPPWIYVAENKKLITAPGQITLDDLKK